MERASRFYIRGKCQGVLAPVGIHRVPYLYLPLPPLVLQADQDRSSPHDLASRTVSHLKAKVSVEEGAASSTSRLDLDEVSGPLKSAPGTDGVVDIDDTYDEEIKEQEGAWTHKIKREHAERVKVWRIAFHFIVPFKTNLRCSSLVEGLLLASEPSPHRLV